jgi:small subunit ribosomal protein S16
MKIFSTENSKRDTIDTLKSRIKDCKPKTVNHSPLSPYRSKIFGMIKLRLKRFGKKFEASYRIVAMNSDTRRDGRPLEELGFYNPRTDEVKLDIPGIVKRLEQGAQPTRTVRSILQKANVFDQLKGDSSTPSSTAAS